MISRFARDPDSHTNGPRRYIGQMQRPSLFRRGLRRAFATVTGLWLVAAVSGAALFICPEHGAMTHAMTHAMSEAHSKRCDTNAHQGSSHQGGGDHSDCSCTGMCCVTASFALSSARISNVPVPQATPRVAYLTPRAAIAPQAAPDLALPPPLGPPTIRT